MKCKKDYMCIFIILIATTIILFPLFIIPRYAGHDTVFHTGNIIYLSKTISIRNILGNNILKINPNPQGYGTYIFYPKLPHLIAAYIYIICKNIYLSMNIIYFITTFLSGIVCFYLSKKMFNNKTTALLSSIIYITFSYHVCDIYVRDAYAENFMFLTIPLIFLGLFELKDNNKENFYLYFIIGYIIGINSHLISMVFCTIFIFLFLIYYHKYFFKKEKIKLLTISYTIITCITLPFTTKIIEHKFLGNYIVFSNLFIGIKSIKYNTLILKALLLEGINNRVGIAIYLNYITTILFILTSIIFLFSKNKEYYKEERRLLLISSIICLILIFSKKIWELLPSFLYAIQFPWRIALFLCLPISLYSPLVFLINNKHLSPKRKHILILIISILMLNTAYNNIIYFKNKEYTHKEIINDLDIMGLEEYMPYNSLETNNSMKKKQDFLYSPSDKRKDLPYRINASDNYKITIIKDDFPSLKFKVTRKEIKNRISKLTEYPNIRNNLINYNNQLNTKIELPRTYYLGYKLKSKNKTIPIYETSNGLIGGIISKDGVYTLTYEGTIFDKISKIIRIITIIIIAVIIIKKKTNTNTEKYNIVT